MTASTKATWTDPRVLLQVIAWVAGLGMLAAQVKANSEQIKETAGVVRQIQERQAAMEAWKSGHEEADRNEPARIRDEIRRAEQERGRR